MVAYTAIHGTNKPSSIGGFVSYGCIRMYNQDIRDLYRLVRVGTPVVVEEINPPFLRGGSIRLIFRKFVKRELVQ